MLKAHWQFLEARLTADPQRSGEAWTALAGRALVPAGLNRPDIMLPLMAHTGEAELASVECDGELLLALPVRRRRGFPRLLESWVTPISISGLAHIDRDRAPEAIGALLRRERAPLLLRGIPIHGPFRDALETAAGHLAIVDRWERAALRPAGTFDGWFLANFDARRRKYLTRHQKRLAKTGVLRFEAIATGDDPAAWAADFLDLEASGWKGRRGTALKCRAEVVAAFTELCCNLHRSGALRFWALRFDAHMIAGLFGVAERGEIWLGKIAYDEAFSRYSPGVQLMLEATRAIFAETGITQVDSCAIPGHPMIDHLWRDRIAVADVLVAGPDLPAWRFAVIVAAERVRRAAREFARSIYYRVTRRRRI
ncbi:MAG: GNAT family N-acetyltransferase [Rhizobiales bacterium]|nr:GNAT family N-acetyltransferase [Hyphomicrobiales bacterium]MBI3674231.1 GNAT family N-acetyltransferase [Hyphomicrobiales bacterium]